jgi:hypothetical protein
LAIQIALQLEKIENKTFKFKTLREFKDDTRRKLEALKTKDPTFLLIPDLCRSWHTEKHITDILDCVRSILSSNTYIIATIRNVVYQGCMTYIRSSVNDVFSRGMIIKPNQETLNKIIKTYILSVFQRFDILQLNSTVGTPLVIMLCMKNPAYRNDAFLHDPPSFIISDLKKMRSSDDVNARMKFGILVYVMLHGGTVEKGALDSCTDPSLFGIKGEIPDMSTNIRGCVKELLDGYLEQTADGKSYRTVHEVIKRCIFLAAAEVDFLSLIDKCDPFLLFDCIRFKTTGENFWQGKEIIIDTRKLEVGVPKELYQNLAKALKQRSDDVTNLLRKVNWVEDKNFQKVWIREN